jgi:hypothetical protein
MYQIKLSKKSLCINIINYTVKFSIKYSTQVINIREISQTDLTAQAIVKMFDKAALNNQTYHLFNPYLFALTGILKNKGFKILSLEQFIAQIFQHLQYSNNYNLLVKFMLHQGWLEKHNSVFFNIKQDKTQQILKQLDFEWPTINDAVFSNSLELLK